MSSPPPAIEPSPKRERGEMPIGLTRRSPSLARRCRRAWATIIAKINKLANAPIQVDISLAIPRSYHRRVTPARSTQQNFAGIDIETDMLTNDFEADSILSR